MKGKSYAAALPLVFGGSMALADVPRVATDIAPVHGLVARVMQGVGEPDLVVQPGASPHGYSMRPSEAQALDQADLVVWVGEALTPWLEGPLETLASDAHVIELLEAKGTLKLEFRSGATFEQHDHGDDHEEHHDDDHETHDDHDDHHAHEDEHGHDDHADHDGHDDHDHQKHDDHAGHDDHEGHSHDGTDPHIWLAPANAQAWLTVIAEELAELDPDNADAYRGNADAGKAEIEAAVQQVNATLEPFRTQNFIVFHDAYQYFEHSFGLSSAGAISLGDASDPSPARIAEIRDAVADHGVTCVFSEPQFNPGLVATVLDSTGAKTVVIDPIGTKIPLGPTFYTDLITGLGNAMASCK
ncbi:zinc ABC transporter substrate-binding protein [Phaeobacter sp. QD34_3]|uniref:zinc ABC transporter substrate-binding protein n=1 Tax=unclassified Phaeobacter TaxID=2621772 RepID=UPI00237F13EF|nr:MULTISPECIES: zinc ABC transporter substrate-binding protein [unclassified Phaeobacter]MDE4134824.1 zinc ABC transporter substrate-binding protein [Phaeobacter sp. QD34_3]MDE4137733.1 zinc ABC transporter substrate-binding protein [Phaeobacter sp. QD34_24]